MCCMLETVGRQTKYDCLPRMGEQERQILDWQTDKYCRQILANIDAQGRKCCQMPTNIVAILHMSWVGPKPSHRIQMTLWEFSFVRKGLVWKDVWGVCTMYMVKHSFKMSIDSKGISMAEWKCQEQLESRLVFCSHRKKTIPHPTNGQVQNVFLYPFPHHSLSPPTFPPVNKPPPKPPPPSAPPSPLHLSQLTLIKCVHFGPRTHFCQGPTFTFF